jgi:hypothetical protein
MEAMEPPIDPFAMIFVTMFVVILLALLAGWALTPRTPSAEPPPEFPGLIFVDLATISMRMEIATNAIETVLRQRGLKRDAEGARQVREAVRHTFEQVKNEHLQAEFLKSLGKSK